MSVKEWKTNPDQNQTLFPEGTMKVQDLNNAGRQLQAHIRQWSMDPESLLEDPAVVINSRSFRIENKDYIARFKRGLWIALNNNIRVQVFDSVITNNHTIITITTPYVPNVITSVHMGVMSNVNGVNHISIGKGDSIIAGQLFQYNNKMYYADKNYKTDATATDDKFLEDLKNNAILIPQADDIQKMGYVKQKIEFTQNTNSVKIIIG